MGRVATKPGDTVILSGIIQERLEDMRTVCYRQVLNEDGTVDEEATAEKRRAALPDDLKLKVQMETEKAELERLRAENAKLKATKSTAKTTKAKTTD